MVDIEKQIEHWLAGADEDWLVARELAGSGHNRHCLFLAHLTLEKIFKAAVCRHTGQLAPPIHNLVRLFERSGIELEKQQVELLAEVNQFNIEGRYPELSLPAVTATETSEYLNRIEEVLSCLKKQF